MSDHTNADVLDAGDCGADTVDVIVGAGSDDVFDAADAADAAEVTANRQVIDEAFGPIAQAVLPVLEVVEPILEAAAEVATAVVAELDDNASPELQNARVQHCARVLKDASGLIKPEQLPKLWQQAVETVTEVPEDDDAEPLPDLLEGVVTNEEALLGVMLPIAKILLPYATKFGPVLTLVGSMLRHDPSLQLGEDGDAEVQGMADRIRAVMPELVAVAKAALTDDQQALAIARGSLIGMWRFKAPKNAEAAKVVYSGRYDLEAMTTAARNAGFLPEGMKIECVIGSQLGDGSITSLMHEIAGELQPHSDVPLIKPMTLEGTEEEETETHGADADEAAASEDEEAGDADDQNATLAGAGSDSDETDA